MGRPQADEGDLSATGRSSWVIVPRASRRRGSRRGRLPEEWSEPFDDRLDAGADRVEHGPNVDALGNRGVLERDVDREAGVYVHPWIRRVEDEPGKQIGRAHV